MGSHATNDLTFFFFLLQNGRYQALAIRKNRYQLLFYRLALIVMYFLPRNKISLCTVVTPYTIHHYFVHN